jgi:5-methylcytosine-specific restriction endonuclease McrA
MRRKRAEDPEAIRQQQRSWHERNRDRNLTKMRDYYARRFFWAKAMKLRGKNRANYKGLASLWRSQRGLCALTGRRLDRSAQLDHILPKAKGGDDQIGNLQWLCPEANLSKRDLTDAEFQALCSDVMRWIGERIDMVDKL